VVAAATLPMPESARTTPCPCRLPHQNTRPACTRRWPCSRRASNPDCSSGRALRMAVVMDARVEQKKTLALGV